MKAISAPRLVPSFLTRAATLLGLWLLIFGAITAMTPSHMEAGYDVTQEKLRVVFYSPILGCLGLASFLGGHRPTLPVILSFVLILGSTDVMLFRCRTPRAFWTLTAVHIIIVTVFSAAMLLTNRPICE